MRCPYCGAETKVINSRLQRRNNHIWRRRRCLDCGAAFTSHETIHLPSVFMVKTSEGEMPFTPELVYQEILACLRDRKNSFEDARELTGTITQKVLKNASNGLILPRQISIEAGRILKRFDRQAYLRFLAEHPSLHD